MQAQENKIHAKNTNSRFEINGIFGLLSSICEVKINHADHS